jgi:DNA-binding IclR family transcriptional regulator
MVLRVAHRQGGQFSVEDVIQTSPLGEEQAREALGRLVASGQVLSEDDGAGRYRIGR